MNLKTEAFQTKKGETLDRVQIGGGVVKKSKKFQLGKVKKSQVPEGTKD